MDFYNKDIKYNSNTNDLLNTKNNINDIDIDDSSMYINSAFKDNLDKIKYDCDYNITQNIATNYKQLKSNIL